MKFYNLTNITKFDFHVIARDPAGRPGFIYTIKPGQSIELNEGQMSGDVQLKLKKRLLSSVEIERETVVSSIKTAAVESENIQKPPLSTRGRKKKQPSTGA
jgi:hypothetical protein